nr:hypothetical protein [uncultured Methanobrevibacter sp.]
MVLNDFLERYEQDLIDKNTREVTEQVTEQVKKSIAKKLKDCLSDLEIAKRTGLSLEEVQKL